MIAINQDNCIDGAQFVAPDRGVVDSAKQLAGMVINALNSSPKVIVSLSGIRGLSSSFFNTLLSDVASVHGVSSLYDRLDFAFDSNAQKMIFDRSFAAVTRSVPRHA